MENLLIYKENKSPLMLFKIIFASLIATSYTEIHIQFAIDYNPNILSNEFAASQILSVLYLCILFIFLLVKNSIFVPVTFFSVNSSELSSLIMAILQF